MVKRRTRKQKIKAKRSLSDIYEQLDKKTASKSQQAVIYNLVKGQSKSKPVRTENLLSRKDSPNTSDKIPELTSTKKDIIKSLSLVSLILALELVIYLVWR